MPSFVYVLDVSEIAEVPEPWKLELDETDRYDLTSIKYVVKRSDKDRSIYKVDRWELVDRGHSKPLQWILHFSKRRYCPIHTLKQVDECLVSELKDEHRLFLENMLMDCTSRPVEDAEVKPSFPLSFEEAKASLARYYGVDRNQVFVSIKSKVGNDQA